MSNAPIGGFRPQSSFNYGNVSSPSSVGMLEALNSYESTDEHYKQMHDRERHRGVAEASSKVAILKAQEDAKNLEWAAKNRESVMKDIISLNVSDEDFHDKLGNLDPRAYALPGVRSVIIAKTRARAALDRKAEKVEQNNQRRISNYMRIADDWPGEVKKDLIEAIDSGDNKAVALAFKNGTEQARAWREKMRNQEIYRQNFNKAESHISSLQSKYSRRRDRLIAEIGKLNSQYVSLSAKGVEGYAHNKGRNVKNVMATKADFEPLLKSITDKIKKHEEALSHLDDEEHSKANKIRKHYGLPLERSTREILDEKLGGQKTTSKSTSSKPKVSKEEKANAVSGF